MDNLLFNTATQWMRGNRRVLFILLCLFSFFCHGQTTLQLVTPNESVLLSDHFKLYYEQENPLSVEQVKQFVDDFDWAMGKNPNYGFYEKGLWLYCRFSNITEVDDWVLKLNFGQLDKVDFYLFEKDQLLAHSQDGKSRIDKSFRVPTLHTELPYAMDLELFVRVESHSTSLIAPLIAQTRANFERSMFYDNTLWGLFYGGLLILAAYNLFLYFGVNEKSLLSYVFYIITIVFWQFVWSGHIELVAPNPITTWLGHHTGLIFVVTTLSSAIFTLTFLDAIKTAPRSHFAVRLCMLAMLLFALTSVLGVFPHMWQNTLVYIAGILSISCFICAGFESYLNKFHPARYFIFAWGLMAIGALVGILSLLGVMPSNEYTAITFQICLFFQACLFSLALMDKNHNQLEGEIQQATNDLRNNMELIEEQNARLDIARKNAIKASNVKSQFLANMSHEIRTPLNAILGFSKELSHIHLPPEKQEQVRIINAAADNLLNIVNDVLDFSKIEAGKLQINNQPFSPNQLLEEMVSVMAKSAQVKQLEFVFELSPLPEKLIGDIFRIRQILNNLLSNAVKFTSSGHVTLSASGKHRDHGIYELLLKVEDTGIGISRQDRKKLFSAFSQVDDALSRSYQGTGLGLVITQELVKLMGGSLNMKSTPGQGSCFSVVLRTNQLSNKYNLAPDSDWQGKEVLIFDPYPFSRRATAGMLHYLGASITCVESLTFLAQQQQKFDYVFASLPHAQQASTEKTLDIIINLKAQRRILTYSGSEPFTRYPNLSQHFYTQIRMPVTANRLDSLLHSPQHQNQNPLQQRMQQLSPAKVLAVDDMDMNLRLLKTWLKPSPLTLTLCHSGRQAVDLCKKQEFDLILMDVQMPGMDGLEASRLIRQTELNLGTPIIAVTAHAFKEEQERLLASGMDDYLPKPIDLSDLIALIKRWCQVEESLALSLPSLDWQLALKRTNQDPQISRQLMTEFIHQLPSLSADIYYHWQQQNMSDLQSAVHKLHGVCCYTGVPKLQALCDEIESALKHQEHHRAVERLPTLISEAEFVVAEGNKHLNKLSQSA